MERNYLKALALIVLFTVVYYLFVLPRLAPEPDKTRPTDTTRQTTPDDTARQTTPDDDPTGTEPDPDKTTTTPGDDDVEDDDTPDDKPVVTRVGGDNLPTDKLVVHTVGEADDKGMVIEFNPVGAGISTILLKEYPPLEIDRGRTDKNVNPEGKPWLALLRTDPTSESQSVPEPGMLIDPKGILPLHTAVWKMVHNPDAGTVTFTAQFSNGLNVTKTYTYSAEDYRLGLDVEVVNTAGRPARTNFDIVASSGMTSEEYHDEDRSLAWGLRDGKQVEHDTVLFSRRFKAFEEQPGRDVLPVDDDARHSLAWTGTTNRYFAMLLMVGPTPAEAPLAEAALVRRIQPDPAANPDKELFGKEVPGNAAVLLRPASVNVDLLDGGQLKPGKSYTRQYLFFAGPMRRDILNRPVPSSYGLDNLVGGGVTHYLQLLFTYILYLFQMVTRNWGLAIILLTVLVRLCMHPLTKKSQVAMHHMQELQPRMKELQEKYKKDKQKLQQETMKLQKEAGFPMFKGCLPMFFQLPIFIALWWSLRTNIFLRGAYLLPPSVGWLDDLSQPDRLYMFSQPVSILFLTIYEINLLPILMVAAMVVQQRMQPKSSNPEQAQQQKVMAVMMSLVFLFFFYTMPSGLTLYFLISTSWGIVEGRIIRKHIDELKSKKALYGKADS